jgi:ribonuclease VapC
VICDSSAIPAIVPPELDRFRFVDAIASTASRRMSAANWCKAAMVVDRRGGPLTAARSEEFLQAPNIELLPPSPSPATLARRTWRLFGRGVHPAGLNYGNCFACAPAKEMREPLLFKGTDFAQTDIEPALKD